uniref:Uncharacterized protein n=1 Tax=Anguilla anguilla TaxID=7936 RepID=A0A0E9XCN2_ANGAN
MLFRFLICLGFVLIFFLQTVNYILFRLGN